MIGFPLPPHILPSTRSYHLHPQRPLSPPRHARRLPEGTTLDDVWQTLVAMHAGESDVLGLLHSLGYVRGLQNALGTPEQTRVELMVRSATRARYAAARRKGLKLVWDLRLNVFRVSALFFFLRFATACLRCLDGRRRGIRRVSPD